MCGLLSELATVQYEAPVFQINLKETLRVWFVEYGCHLKSSNVLLNQMKNVIRKLGWIRIDQLTALHLSEDRNDRLRTVGPPDSYP